MPNDPQVSSRGRICQVKCISFIIKTLPAKLTHVNCNLRNAILTKPASRDTVAGKSEREQFLVLYNALIDGLGGTVWPEPCRGLS